MGRRDSARSELCSHELRRKQSPARRTVSWVPPGRLGSLIRQLRHCDSSLESGRSGVPATIDLCGVKPSGYQDQLGVGFRLDALPVSVAMTPRAGDAWKTSRFPPAKPCVDRDGKCPPLQRWGCLLLQSQRTAHHVMAHDIPEQRARRLLGPLLGQEDGTEHLLHDLLRQRLAGAVRKRDVERVRGRGVGDLQPQLQLRWRPSPGRGDPPPWA
jgi:hypothetical protein